MNMGLLGGYVFSLVDAGKEWSKMRIFVAKVEFIIWSNSALILEFFNKNYKAYTEDNDCSEHTIKVRVDVENDSICSSVFSPKLGWEMRMKGYVLSVNNGVEQKLLRAYTDLAFTECIIKMQNVSIESLELVISVLWRIISARYGVTLLHASAFVHREMSCVCCAHSGGGKSTFLEMMKMPKLTDEMSCIISKDDTFGASIYQTIPWRNLLEINTNYPLGIICVLNKAEETYVRQIPESIAAILVGRFLYFNFWIKGSRERVGKGINQIVKSVPVVECGFSLTTSPQEVLMLFDKIMNGLIIR